ncbi:MAG: DUF1593 domain-containing protein, partial [Planctomycetes bacterium]|nr:DUF1593 domain-containing protein [Planctomycetota bacterium]
MKTIFSDRFAGGLLVSLLVLSHVFSSQALAESDNASLIAKESEGIPRLRVIVETDAGGDPDDEQSMVRFLLYCNEWDVEGIICTRPKAR